MTNQQQSEPEIAADDYLDDDAPSVDPEQNEWWLTHKRQRHRVDWPFGGLPMCYTCGTIYGKESAMTEQQQSETEIAAEGGRSRRMDLLCPACGHKLGSTMAHPEPLTRDHRAVTVSVILDSAPTPPSPGEGPVSPGEQ